MDLDVLEIFYEYSSVIELLALPFCRFERSI